MLLAMMKMRTGGKGGLRLCEKTLPKRKPCKARKILMIASNIIQQQPNEPIGGRSMRPSPRSKECRMEPLSDFFCAPEPTQVTLPLVASH